MVTYSYISDFKEVRIVCHHKGKERIFVVIIFNAKNMFALLCRWQHPHSVSNFIAKLIRYSSLVPDSNVSDSEQIQYYFWNIPLKARILFNLTG